MNKQLKFGIVLQYLQMILSALISLIYTPIMLRILGTSEYGLYNLSSSIISYLSLLSLGFGSSYLKFYSLAKHKNENDVSNLNALYLITFFIIALISVVIGFSLSFNVEIFMNSTYSMVDVEIAKKLLIILTINLAMTFISSVFVNYITSQERFIFLKIISLGKTVISPALSIIALFMGYGSIGLVLATTIISTFVDIVLILFSIFKLKMKFKFIKVDFKLLKPIFVFSIFIAINSIVDQINWQTDKIILGKMIGSVAVAIYGIGSTINSLYINIGVAISSVFAPRVNEIVAKNNQHMDDDLTNLMVSVGQIQFVVLGLVLTGFIIFGKFFISIWAGPDFWESYYIAILLIVPVTIALIQNIGIEIQRAKNKHKFRSIVYLIIAFSNIGISILLCRFLGIIGITIGTTISLLVGNGLIMNIYYHKVLHLDMVRFWKGIFTVALRLIPPLLLGIVLGVFTVTNLKTFIISIIIYSSIYCVFVYFLLIKKNKIIIYSSMK